MKKQTSNIRALSFAVECRADNEGGEWDIRGVASADSVDSHGWRIPMSSFTQDLAVFMQNPLFLLNHPMGWGRNGEEGLPIGSVTRLWVEGEKLMFEAKFAGTELAQKVKTLFEEGHLRMFSIGFYPLETRKPTNEELGKFGPHDVTAVRVQLLEVSAVLAGSNPGAFAEVVRSVGEQLKGYTVPVSSRADLSAQVEAVNAAFAQLGKACEKLIKASMGDEESPEDSEGDSSQESPEEGRNRQEEHDIANIQLAAALALLEAPLA